MALKRRTFLAALPLLFTPRDVQAASPDTVLFGDSHSYILGPWFRAEAMRYKVPVAVVPEAGSSVRQWLAKKWIQKLLKRYANASNYLVSLGTNCTRVERPRLADDIKRLIGLIGQDRVTWLLPPKLKMDTTYLHEAVKESGVFAIDPGELPLWSDGIHTTFKGSELWADLIARTIW